MRPIFGLTLLTCHFCLIPGVVYASDWYKWRGPHRDDEPACTCHTSSWL